MSSRSLFDLTITRRHQKFELVEFTFNGFSLVHDEVLNHFIE
jgi:hypothetical protein